MPSRERARDFFVNPKHCFFIVFACLALFRAAAFAQHPPDAAAVADKIGQEIEFQDEVKAVSYSRSTKGYYLSFGAPYPSREIP